MHTNACRYAAARLTTKAASTVRHPAPFLPSQARGWAMSATATGSAACQPQRARVRRGGRATTAPQNARMARNTPVTIRETASRKAHTAPSAPATRASGATTAQSSARAAPPHHATTMATARSTAHARVSGAGAALNAKLSARAARWCRATGGTKPGPLFHRDRGDGRMNIEGACRVIPACITWII